MAKRNLIGKPADPMNPRGFIMALRMRGIDPSPFTELADQLQYPVTFVQPDHEANPDLVNYWEKDDNRLKPGKVLKAFTSTEQVDARIEQLTLEIGRLESTKVEIEAANTAAEEAAKAAAETTDDEELVIVGDDNKDEAPKQEVPTPAKKKSGGRRKKK